MRKATVFDDLKEYKSKPEYRAREFFEEIKDVMNYIYDTNVPKNSSKKEKFDKNWRSLREQYSFINEFILTYELRPNWDLLPSQHLRESTQFKKLVDDITTKTGELIFGEVVRQMRENEYLNIKIDDKAQKKISDIFEDFRAYELASVGDSKKFRNR